MVTVSGGAFGTVVLTPSTSRTFESLADTTIWACASAQRMHARIGAVTTIAGVNFAAIGARVFMQRHSIVDAPR